MSISLKRSRLPIAAADLEEGVIVMMTRLTDKKA
jgi:hypothetical protein